MTITKRIRGGALVALIVVTIYSVWSWFFQTGLYAFLILSLTKTFDLFLPVITGILMWFVLSLVPFFLIFRAKKKHEYEYTRNDLAAKLRANTRWLALATLVCAGLSGSAFYVASNAPTADQPATVVDVSASLDQPLWFKKVSLQGVAITRSATFTQGTTILGDETVTRFTPIASSRDRGELIRFIQATSGASVAAVTKSNTPLEGYVLPATVPVLIRDSLEKDGLVIAGRHHVIGSEAFDLRSLLIVICGFLAFLSLALLIRLVTMPSRNRRKLQGIQDHQHNNAPVEWR